MDPKIASRVKDGWKSKTAEAGAGEDALAPPVVAPLARKAGKEAPKRKRKTQYQISEDLDEKVAVYCRRHHVTRSAFAEEAFREKVSGVTISFRGKAGEELTAA